MRYSIFHSRSSCLFHSVMLHLLFIQLDPQARLGGNNYISVPVVERLGNDVVLIVYSGYALFPFSLWGRYRHHARQRCHRGRGSQMEIGGIADSRLDGTVDVALKAPRLGYGRNLFRLKEAARLRGIKGNNLRGPFPHDFQNVLRCPRALVRHNWRSDPPRNLSHRIDAFHRLFHITDTVFFHRLNNLHRDIRRGIALVGIHRDLDLRADRLSDPPYQLHIALRLLTALELDRLDAFIFDLQRFFHCLIDLHQPDAVGYRDALPVTATQELIGRYLESLPDDVVKRHVDGCLAIGITFNGLIHQRVERRDLTGILPFQRRSKNIIDNVNGRLGSFPVVFHVVTAPVLQHRRLSQTDQPLIGFQFDDDIDANRSEEHTSELQSQSNLVCRLLLEKIQKPISQSPFFLLPIIYTKHCFFPLSR